MNWITSPKVQDQVAEFFGEAPANPKACDVSAAAQANCDAYHEGDAAYFKNIWFWTTPLPQCLDGRSPSETTCTDYSDWTQAWTDVKG
jgi:putative spermidine/putrescine transport system substrate-binding protein